MTVARKKKVVYALLCSLLFVIFLIAGLPVWFLFLILTIYNAYAAMKPNPQHMPPQVTMQQVSYGKFGTYEVHGDPEDLSYGTYIELHGKPVFIAIREDHHLEARKQRATMLYENRSILENNLQQFVASNPEFQQRELKDIGLHSDDLEQGEVFWEPEGYTLLRGLRFVK
jgi:hypothetical protein